ncbi:haloacid dehalogenase [Sulfolobales archaeon HS-7]|nr:haloacid dehalogenase [Sulfolobales archaeon HS-7]
MLSEKIAIYIEKITPKLEERFENREKVLQLSREIIRLSGEAISFSHRGKSDSAVEKFHLAIDKVRQVKDLIHEYPELLTGDAGTAFQELTEAYIVLSYQTDRSIELPEDMNIPIIFYVLGVADAVGELRRICLEQLRKGNYTYAQEMYKEMENLYEILWRLEYPKAMVPSLRQKIDNLRRILEETSHDLFLASITTYSKHTDK